MCNCPFGGRIKTAVLQQTKEHLMDLVQEALSYVDGLSESLSSTAEWRRGKVEQFPDDDRNLKAAVLLEELAKQIEPLSGTKLDRRLVTTWKAAEKSGRGGCLSEEESQLLRDVGFHWWGSATDFVEELISRINRVS
jgi:hypothetical protein